MRFLLACRHACSLSTLRIARFGIMRLLPARASPPFFYIFSYIYKKEPVFFSFLSFRFFFLTVVIVSICVAVDCNNIVSCMTTATQPHTAYSIIIIIIILYIRVVLRFIGAARREILQLAEPIRP